MGETKEMCISEQEAEQYDRQIRLWGLDAQKRLRAARVLIVGLGGLGAEVSKNVILAGVQAVTLLDHRGASESDQSCQFLLDTEGLKTTNRAVCSVARASQLNPMVQVSADSDQVSSKEDQYFLQYDVICVTDCDTPQLVRLNDLCHANNIQFFCGDVFGHYGFMFIDLNRHDYVEEIKKSVAVTTYPESSAGSSSNSEVHYEIETVTEKRCEVFRRFKEAMQTTWKSGERSIKKTPKTHFIIRILLKYRDQYMTPPGTYNKDDLLKVKNLVCGELGISEDVLDDTFASFCNGELSPSCAIVGGVIAQEMIKAISHKDRPINNFFVFDPFTEYGMVDCF